MYMKGRKIPHKNHYRKLYAKVKAIKLTKRVLE
jgi:hypothetical protein